MMSCTPSARLSNAYCVFPTLFFQNIRHRLSVQIFGSVGCEILKLSLFAFLRKAEVISTLMLLLVETF